jgi:hypothetical protein
MHTGLIMIRVVIGGDGKGVSMGFCKGVEMVR